MDEWRRLMEAFLQRRADSRGDGDGRGRALPPDEAELQKHFAALAEARDLAGQFRLKAEMSRLVATWCDDPAERESYENLAWTYERMADQEEA